MAGTNTARGCEADEPPLGWMTKQLPKWAVYSGFNLGSYKQTAKEQEKIHSKPKKSYGNIRESGS